MPPFWRRHARPRTLEPKVSPKRGGVCGNYFADPTRMCVRGSKGGTAFWGFEAPSRPGSPISRPVRSRSGDRVALSQRGRLLPRSRGPGSRPVRSNSRVGSCRGSWRGRQYPEGRAPTQELPSRSSYDDRFRHWNEPPQRMCAVIDILGCWSFSSMHPFLACHLLRRCGCLRCYWGSAGQATAATVFCPKAAPA